MRFYRFSHFFPGHFVVYSNETFSQSVGLSLRREQPRFQVLTAHTYIIWMYVYTDRLCCVQQQQQHTHWFFSLPEAVFFSGFSFRRRSCCWMREIQSRIKITFFQLQSWKCKVTLQMHLLGCCRWVTPCIDGWSTPFSDSGHRKPRQFTLEPPTHISAFVIPHMG